MRTGLLSIVFFFSFFFLGGEGGGRDTNFKININVYVIRFSFFSFNEIESKFLIYIYLVKLFYTDFLFGLLNSCCRSAYSDDWDIFTYTQEWPVAVCIKGKEEVKDSTQGFKDSRNYQLNNAAEFRSFLYIFLLYSTTLVLFHLACRDGEFTACGKHAILIFTLYNLYITIIYYILKWSKFPPKVHLSLSDTQKIKRSLGKYDSNLKQETDVLVNMYMSI